MDFQSAMETFAEAWMAANTKARPDSSDHQVRRKCNEWVHLAGGFHLDLDST